MHALSLADVARELGRSEDWVARNWQHLADRKGMPRPLHPNGTLAWSSPGFYAWLDKDLPPALRPHAAAYRAAFAAALAPADDVAQSRATLDARFATKETAS